MAKTVQVDVVSAETKIFSGLAEMVIAHGTLGELGIYPGHTALVTTLKPGVVTLKLSDNEEEVIYVSGGLLEVQPDIITVLADTGARAADLDEVAALEAKQRAEEKVIDRKSELEYSRALTELAEAAAQLRAIQKLRGKN